MRVYVMSYSNNNKFIVNYREHVRFPLETVPNWDLDGFSAVNYAILVMFLLWHHPVKLTSKVIVVVVLISCECLYLLNFFDAATERASIGPFYIQWITKLCYIDWKNTIRSFKFRVVRNITKKFLYFLVSIWNIFQKQKQNIQVIIKQSCVH